jgi:hypothetical protein
MPVNKSLEGIRAQGATTKAGEDRIAWHIGLFIEPKLK